MARDDSRLLASHLDNLVVPLIGWTQQTSKLVGSGPKVQEEIEVAEHSYYCEVIT